MVGGQTTVYTTVDDTVTLPCDIGTYPEWKGPILNGNTQYNIDGYGYWVSNVGSKKDRLSWGSNNGDLIITNVVKEEDEGQYTCSSANPSGSTTIQVVVRGKYIVVPF